MDRPSILRSALSDRIAGRRVVASTDIVDRNRRKVAQVWDLERFEANPVLLWDHEAERLPIGTASVSVHRRRDVGARLEAELHFDDGDDAPEFNRQVARAWDLRLLNAVSVGWLPQDWGEVKDVFDENTGEWLFTEFPANELLELSITPVPANSEAVRMAAKLELELGAKPELIDEARKGALSVAAGRHRLNRARLERARR